MRKLTVSSGLSLRLSIFGDVPPTTPDGMWTFLAFLLMTDTENFDNITGIIAGLKDDYEAAKALFHRKKIAIFSGSSHSKADPTIQMVSF